MVETATVRKWVLDSNDGIISTTGIIQGFAGAGASDETVLFAAVTLMITGGLSLGGSAYAEAAQDRAAELAIIEEQQRRLAMSPDEERAELREHYVKRGLDPRLADQVASQLMTRDPLGAQLETEFGILDGANPPLSRSGSRSAASSPSSAARCPSRLPSSSSTMPGASRRRCLWWSSPSRSRGSCQRERGPATR